MSPSEETKSYAGWFQLPSGEGHHGRLTLCGPETRLTLWGGEEFRLAPGSLAAVTGVIENSKSVSLFDCIHVGGKGFPLLPDPTMSQRVDLFPHHVFAGYKHIGPTDNAVSAVSFSVPDANALFHTRKRMTVLMSSPELLEEVLRVHSDSWEPDIGDTPEIAIHAGFKVICSSPTSIGDVSVTHAPAMSMNMVSGPSVQNQVSVRIEFDKALDVRRGVSRAGVVSRFLELIIGRPQRPIQVYLEVGKDARGGPETLEVYHTTAYGFRSRVRGRDPGDMLIDPIAESDEFSKVLRRWIDRDDTWENARVQFSKAWCRDYGENRAIRAANIFDLIPDLAFAGSPPLPGGVVEARDRARSLFLDVSRGPERDSVLGALGRVGDWTLKQRIRHRSQILVEQIGHRISEINRVTDAAVDWRNEIVHGTPARVDGAKHVSFLTNTLEFVFGASDLVEAGWDIVGWLEAGHLRGHPFFEYLLNYEENLKRLGCRGGQDR